MKRTLLGMYASLYKDSMCLHAYDVSPEIRRHVADRGLLTTYSLSP